MGPLHQLLLLASRQQTASQHESERRVNWCSAPTERRSFQQQQLVLWGQTRSVSNIPSCKADVHCLPNSLNTRSSTRTCRKELEEYSRPVSWNRERRAEERTFQETSPHSSAFASELLQPCVLLRVGLGPERIRTSAWRFVLLSNLKESARVRAEGEQVNYYGFLWKWKLSWETDSVK